MKSTLFLTILATGFLAFGCASSEKNSYQEEDLTNLVQINPPTDQNHDSSNLYIDTVELINFKERDVLLITGSFPDACTYLKEASDTLVNDSLRIRLKAWRKSDAMCAQVLTSFSFIYDQIPADILNQRSTVTVNKRTYQIQ